MAPDRFEDDADFCADVEAGMLGDAVLIARLTEPQAAPGSGRQPLDHAALWRHATRAPDASVEIGTLRLLRERPEARAALARMIAGRAIASSALAWAAAGGDVIARKIGSFRLSIERDGEAGVAVVIIELDDGTARPTLLRGEGEAGSAVLRLPAPEDGRIELYFFGGDDRARATVDLLAAPSTLIALE